MNNTATKITIEEIAEKLTAAGCEVAIRGDKVFVNSTPNGGSGRYGYLVAGDNGSTGTCSGISKRAGEIAALLRK